MVIYYKFDRDADTDGYRWTDGSGSDLRGKKWIPVLPIFDLLKIHQILFSPMKNNETV